MTDANATADGDALLREIASDRGEGPHISLVVPSTPLPSERQKNEIRLKNRIAEAAAQLEELGLDERRCDALLEPLRERQQQGTLWPDPHLDGGMAVYCNGETLHRFVLPMQPKELTVVGWRYHVKPVLEGRSRVTPWSLLAISQNEVRLYTGDHDGLRALDLAGHAPRSLEESAGHEVSEPNLQYHAGQRGSAEAIYHAHGGGKDDVTPELRRFLREVDEAVQDLLPDRDAPLVLAGVESLLAIYRQVSGLPGVIEEALQGNVEHLSAAELHERASDLVERRQAELNRAAARRLAETVGSERASADLDEVVLAAVEGRVEEIVVPGDREVWGYLDAGAHQVRRREEFPREDLLDRAAVETWLHGGRVRVLQAGEIPSGKPLLAAFRYS